MPIPINSANNKNILNRIGQTSNALAGNLSKLASGKRINSAADDAAGMAISAQLQSKIASTDQASSNISQGGAMLRTAEGGLGQIGEMLSRGRELAVQAANGTLNDQQRKAINTEFTNIKQEIDRVTQTTEYNGQQLLTGGLGPNAQNPPVIQAGINASPNDRITINQINASDTASLGISGLSLDTAANAANALQGMDAAISSVVQNRAGVGAMENRLQSGASNLAVSKENLTAAETQISGLDYAAEISSMKQNQVAMKAGLSALKSGLRSQEQMIGGLLNTKG